MKIITLSFLILVGTLTAQAEILRVGEQGSGMDYSYLTFETTDGAKTSVDVSSLPVTINLDNSTLTIGNQTFVLVDLSKMYFSTQSETTGIETVDNGQLTMENSAEFYDLQGHRVSKDQLRKGVYIVKTQSRTYKLVVK